MPKEDLPETNKPSIWKRLPSIWKRILQSLGAAAGLIALLTLIHQVVINWPEPSSAPVTPTFTESPAPLTPSETREPDTAPPTSATDESETPPTQTETGEADQDISEARIEVDEDFLVKPNTVSSGQSPGFEPFVFTAAGRLSAYDPCYVNWKLYNNSQLVAQEDTRCEKEGMASTFWPLDIELKPGTVKVLAEITTGWGATKNVEVDLKVQ